VRTTRDPNSSVSLVEPETLECPLPEQAIPRLGCWLEFWRTDLPLSRGNPAEGGIVGVGPEAQRI
jgi:hypothetical protein